MPKGFNDLRDGPNLQYGIVPADRALSCPPVPPRANASIEASMGFSLSSRPPAAHSSVHGCLPAWIRLLLSCLNLKIGRCNLGLLQLGFRPDHTENGRLWMLTLGLLPRSLNESYHPSPSLESASLALLYFIALSLSVETLRIEVGPARTFGC